MAKKKFVFDSGGEASVAAHVASKIHLLRGIPLFSALPESEIENLAGTLKTVHLPAGVILFEEGGSDSHCYILHEGKVEIIKSLGTADERVLAVRESGIMLGEMSLFTSTKVHTASVRSLTSLMLLKITRVEYDRLLHRQPEMAYAITEMLTRRLDESENLTILDLREKNLQLTQAYEELKAAHEQIVEKERLEKELEIAHRIQISILPQEIPQLSGLDCGALMIPARAVGGDFYDFIPLGENLLGVVVGDVSDKGVPAALFMALTYSLVRSEAGHSLDPAQTLLSVNRHLIDINASGMFVTLLYGVLDTQSGEFSFARAGHLSPFLSGPDNVEIPVSHQLGQALGLLDEPVLDQGRIDLPPGGRLVLFSDGLSEAADSRGEYFDLDRLAQLLKENREASAQQLCEATWQAVQDFSAGMPQADDFTIAVLHWHPGEGR